MTGDDGCNSIGNRIDIEMRDVVHDVEPLAADVDDGRGGQGIGPLALVVVAANRRDGRDATQTLEISGVPISPAWMM